jgi:isocitrate dehydrogenase kinase/phosphatase
VLRHLDFVIDSGLVIRLSPFFIVSSPTSSLTDSRLPAICAEAARDAFAEYETHFDEITRRARMRFLTRDWRGSFDDTRERLRLYSLILDSLTIKVRELMGERVRDRAVLSPRV